MVLSSARHQLPACKAFFLEEGPSIKFFQAIPKAILRLLWIESNRSHFSGNKTYLNCNKKCVSRGFYWQEEAFCTSLTNVSDYVEDLDNLLSEYNQHFVGCFSASFLVGAFTSFFLKF